MRNEGSPFERWADAVEAAGFPRPNTGSQRSYRHSTAMLRRMFLERGELTYGECAQAVRRHGGRYHSTARTLQDLLEHGEIVRVSRGVYRAAKVRVELAGVYPGGEEG